MTNTYRPGDRVTIAHFRYADALVGKVLRFHPLDSYGESYVDVRWDAEDDGYQPADELINVADVELAR
jgi:hypothetical protein